MMSADHMLRTLQVLDKLLRSGDDLWAPLLMPDAAWDKEDHLHTQVLVDTRGR